MKKIIDSIKEDLKDSIKKQDNVKKSVYRFILSAIHNEEIKLGKELGEDEVLKLLIKQAQQRKDSIEAFEKANRDDLVQKESQELEIISQFLPEQVSEEKIKELAAKAISDTNAQSVKDLGKVMPLLMKQLGGKAEGKIVNKIVMELLN
ncbi:MAG: aspartyl-tRNA amidotransferase [Chloroflexi bacterium]|nr:aspartyl-tRNA amidotransferase [Chloroflexota bacterium]|tara:strand:- start:849 stop:1295 length:447 start_codon:yes stop_codon:yes gene_type:complete